jgi:thymidylate synthase ThyX
MTVADKEIKYVCSECFKEFPEIHKEIAESHARFTHTHNATLIVRRVC